MTRKKKPFPIFENVTIEDVAAEGKSIARITIPAHDGTPESQLVVFVPWCVPGDVVDLQVRRKKHNYAEAEVVKFRRLSEVRAVPVCSHFGVCVHHVPPDRSLIGDKCVFYCSCCVGWCVVVVIVVVLVVVVLVVVALLFLVDKIFALALQFLTSSFCVLLSPMVSTCISGPIILA